MIPQFTEMIVISKAGITMGLIHKKFPRFHNGSDSSNIFTMTIKKFNTIDFFNAKTIDLWKLQGLD